MTGFPRSPGGLALLLVVMAVTLPTLADALPAVIHGAVVLGCRVLAGRIAWHFIGRM